MSSDPVIKLSSLTKTYRTQLALDSVSLEIPAGVVFALLGENGAGKSTTIRIMTGMTQPTSGEARVLGMDCRRDGLRIRQRVGYVSERPSLYEWMKVSEIGWFAAGFRPPGFEAEFQKLCQRFELPLGRKIKALSKGMRAKVSLSLALAHRPDLLILDEPTSGLDTLVRREFLDSMIDIAAQDRTVFLSSHQISEVERVADVVAIMRRGKLLAVENVDRLKSDTTEVIITLADGVSDIPSFDLRGCQIISQTIRGRQSQLVVRGEFTEHVNWLDNHPSVHAVETRPLGLEDIFVAYMQSDEDAGGTSVQADTVRERAAR